MKDLKMAVILLIVLRPRIQMISSFEAAPLKVLFRLNDSRMQSVI